MVKGYEATKHSLREKNYMTDSCIMTVERHHSKTTSDLQFYPSGITSDAIDCITINTITSTIVLSYQLIPKVAPQCSPFVLEPQLPNMKGKTFYLILSEDKLTMYPLETVDLKTALAKREKNQFD